jgi:hypothetical protein
MEYYITLKLDLDSDIEHSCDEVEDVIYEELNSAGITVEDLTVRKRKGQLSDGSHTFDELYYHRMTLFSVICNTYADKSWKSWKHHDGTMYDDYFIVGITTEYGDFTYHYHKKHWIYFRVKELEFAPEWDGHTSSDIERLCTLI